MNSIKFSHKYSKLANQKSALLMEVLPVKLENLHEEFLIYDTLINTKTGERYPLPKKGDYLLLIFYGNSSRLFTTIRRSTPQKYKYYSNLIGKEFSILVKEEI